MAFSARGAIAAVILCSSGVMASAADRAIIVLDASGSMWGQIDGRPKAEIARETLRSVLQSVPGDVELGLMAYGHREKGSCTDIELVVPPSPGTAQAISVAAEGMQFRGKTPLTAAVRRAAEALKFREEKATVILVTDGVETCEADPCALGKDLEATGADFTAHVVGFGLSAEEGREVACLAETTGGNYLQASNALALRDALAAAVAAPASAPPEPAPPVVAEPAPAPAPEPPPEPAKPEFNFLPQAVMAAGGEPLQDAANAWEIFKADADGSAGERVATEYGSYKGSLEPGDYLVRARLGEAAVEQKIKVEAGEVYQPVFNLDAGTLLVRPRASEGGETSTVAKVQVDFPGGTGPATSHGETKFVLPAGEQKLTVGIGTGKAEETIRLAAGETIEKDVVVGVGRVAVNALYAPAGDTVEETSLFVEIFKAKLDVDGSREGVTSAYGPDAKFDLAPGDHVAVLRLDKAVAEQPFNIRAGEAKDVTVVLQAGILSIVAPGARNTRIFAAKEDSQGNRKEFGYGFDGAHQVTLPAGDYVVDTEFADGAPAKETPVTVKAGERVDLKIE